MALDMIRRCCAGLARVMVQYRKKELAGIVVIVARFVMTTATLLIVCCAEDQVKRQCLFPVPVVTDGDMLPA